MTQYPKKVDDLTKNYLILYEKSTSIPGDERSRTNPGHGYPAHTEQSWEIEQFDTEEEWKKEIISLKSRAFPTRNWKALVCDYAKIKTKFEVVVE